MNSGYRGSIQEFSRRSPSEAEVSTWDGKVSGLLLHGHGPGGPRGMVLPEVGLQGGSKGGTSVSVRDTCIPVAPEVSGYNDITPEQQQLLISSNPNSVL